MKTKITFLKAALVTLLLFISTTTFADNYYVCTGGTIGLSTPATPPTGTHFEWDVKVISGSGTVTGYPKTTPPTSLPTAGVYEVILITVLDNPATATTICLTDPVPNTFTVIDPLTISTANPTNPTYCGFNSTIKSSDIAITAGTVPSAYATDLESEITYKVSKTTTAVPTPTDVDPATVGTIDPATGKYTLTTTDAGTYTITVSIKYKSTAASTTPLLGPGCPQISSETVTVQPKPTTPTVTVVGS